MSDTSSLAEALRALESDLARGTRHISAHSGIPFAILRYHPHEEFAFRRQIRMFAQRLREQHRLHSHFVSLSRQVWKAVESTRDELFHVERLRGFGVAQKTDVERHIRPADSRGRGPLRPLYKRIQEEVASAAPAPDLVFLVRAGGLAPHIYRASALLNDLQQAGFTTPTLLCYPGSAVAGADLRFYDLPSEEGLGTYNYRVKIYGTT